MKMWKLTKLAGILASASVAEPAAQAASFVGGRVVFWENGHELTASETERSHWGRITVEFRQGRQTVSVRPDEDGVFAVATAPGRWSIAYVILGEHAVFFAPQELVVQPNSLACTGTLVVPLMPAVADESSPRARRRAGASAVAKDVEVRQDCMEFERSLKSQVGQTDDIALARLQPLEKSRAPRSTEALLAGVRAEIGYAQTDQVWWHGRYVYPLSGTLPGSKSLHITAMAGVWTTPVVSNPDDNPHYKSAWVGSLGVGYSLWKLEARTEGGYLQAGGPAGSGWFWGPSLFLDGTYFGVGASYLLNRQGDKMQSLFVTVSPVALIGGML